MMSPSPSAGAAHCDTPKVSLTAGSVSDQGRESPEKKRWRPCPSKNWLVGAPESLERCVDSGVGITNLPAELVVKILSNLDFTDITACRYVNRRWQALIDRSHLQPLAFSRSLYFQPIPQTVQHYNSFTRGWLASFSDRAKEFVEGLDTLLEHRYFPEMLFFAIAVVLSETTLLTCQNVYTIRHFDWVVDASFSPDGRHLATASADHTAKIWELVAGQWLEKATIRHSDFVNNVTFSPDGKYLATASRDHTAKIWQFVAGQWQGEVTIQHRNSVGNASFSPHGSYLATASDDGTVAIWNTGQLPWQQHTGKQGHPEAILRQSGSMKDACFSADGCYLLTASNECTAKIWELVAGQWQEKATIEHLSCVKNASFSPDGRYLVTVSITDSSNHTAKIRELVAGQWQEKASICHSNWVTKVIFSPDGSHLVTTSDDHTAKIWGLAAGQWEEIDTLRHPAPVFSANFSPDGCHLVTTSADNTARIWGVVDGDWHEKVTIRHLGWVRYASFSPDGSHLVTASDDNTAKIWLLKGKEFNDIP